MIVEIKTKQPVIYEAIKSLTAIVYLRMNELRVTESGYEALTQYGTKDEDGKFYELINEATKFSREEALQLYAALGAQGTTFDEQLFDLFPKALMYVAGGSGYWGLGGEDWEIIS